MRIRGGSTPTCSLLRATTEESQALGLEPDDWDTAAI
jgi:hypothetical protein